MPGKEAKDAGGYTPPTPEELTDPVAQLSVEYIGLLREAHSTMDSWKPTEEQSRRVVDTIERIVVEVPNIDEDTLRSMIDDNPNAAAGWYWGSGANLDDTEFHRLALDWDNEDAFYSGNRQLAERLYGITPVEVDFLSKGARILEPIPSA